MVVLARELTRVVPRRRRAGLHAAAVIAIAAVALTSVVAAATGTQTAFEPAATPIVPAASHAVTLEDLKGLVLADTSLQLSPSGEYLAYSRLGGIWLVRTRVNSVPRKIADGFSPKWSPAGDRLAYYANVGGNVQLNVMDTKREESVRLTDLAGGIDPDPTTSTGPIDWAFAYSWSPDGAAIVFSSRVPVQNETLPNSVVSASNSAESGYSGPLVLTGSTPDYWTLRGVFVHDESVGRGVFESKDGRDTRLKPPRARDVALVSQLFIVDVGTKRMRRLTADDRTYFSPDWSPNSRSIVCSTSDQQRSLLGATTLQIAIVDAVTGVRVDLTDSVGMRRSPTWSPDGKSIAYLDSETPYSEASLFTGNPGTKHFRNVTAELNRHIDEYAWSPDGKSLLVTYRDGVSHPLARIDVEPLGIVLISGLGSKVPLYASRVSASKAGSIAWENSEPRNPGVIMILAHGARVPVTLVNLYPETEQWITGNVEIVRWKNQRGDDMEGVLALPLGYERGRKYPLIVDVYPLATAFVWTAPMAGNLAWATAGYAVLLPEPRAPHAWLNHWKSPESARAGKGSGGWDVAYDDVMSGVDEVIHRGIADPQRMCLYGFSNGGGVVNDLVTRTSRFKCAVSVSGVFPDWTTEALMWTGHFEPLTAWVGTSLFEDPTEYVKLSPVFRANRVKTPMLLAAGDQEQFLFGVVEMYNGLRAAGADVTFLRYPGQGHGFAGAALDDFWRREMQFFAEHMGGGIDGPVPH